MPLSVTAISTCGVVPLQHHLHRTAAWRELDGVRQQVPDDLLQAAGIAGDRSGRRVEDAIQPDVLGDGRRRHRLDRRVDERERMQRLQVEPELARVDAAHVEQVVDELRLDPRVALDGLEAGQHLLGAAGGDAQHLGPAEDGVERRAQLVRQRGQEVVLGVAHALGLGAGGAFAVEQRLALVGGALRLFVEAGVVDGDAGLAGDAEHQPLGALGEDAGVGMPEDEPAEDLARPRPHRDREVAAHRQVTRRQAVVRAHRSVARIGEHVVDADRLGAAERRLEQGGHARQADVLERLARRARERIELVAIASWLVAL